ncbi:ferredoxin--NADP reductase [Kutzneria chonburiensis]|uniref:2Fe-2S iron-sulfur cluster-binding protein n=1 Tax=Kutzneria chonburiensis TaxID=1483604 RepID=A0ABV6MP25_9PSEU|nr:ferredoxin--NADP reductase [Kutzneria chonburiensis]
MTEPVRVAEVIEETADAVSLVLDASFSYEPGQFLTFRLPNGLERCYSLSSSPYTGEKPTVTVKRMAGGACSSWICSDVVAGTVLETRPPAGVFTPASLDDDLLLFAGGSGITPVMSIVKSVLASGSGRVVLFYANRDPASVIFAGELRRLAAEHPSRLQVVHWLECLQGLPSRAQLAGWAAPFAGWSAFVCGPAPFMDAVVSVLPSARVERFDVVQEEVADTGESSTVDVLLDGVSKRLTWPSHKRLLDVLLDNGLDAPYSCRQGQCSACACRIVRGEVRLLHNEVLDADDLADGYALACQALPVTDEVEISYTD